MYFLFNVERNSGKQGGLCLLKQEWKKSFDNKHIKKSKDLEGNG